MKHVIIICPVERPGVGALALKQPLVLAPFLGQSVLEHALGAVAAAGAKRLTILAGDRTEVVRAAVGRGERWGVAAEVVAVEHEPSPAEVVAGTAPGEADEAQALVLDHLPQLPAHPLWTSYEAWFAAQLALLPLAAQGEVGMRELQPGVFVGLRSQIAPDATLRGPCWIGSNVRIGAGAVVGPEAVISDDALVDDGAEVRGSIVAPRTYVGAHVEVRGSFAQGASLLNFRSGSLTTITDRFLLGETSATAPAICAPADAGKPATGWRRWLPGARQKGQP